MTTYTNTTYFGLCPHDVIGINFPNLESDWWLKPVKVTRDRHPLFGCLKSHPNGDFIRGNNDVTSNQWMYRYAISIQTHMTCETTRSIERRRCYPLTSFRCHDPVLSLAITT